MFYSLAFDGRLIFLKGKDDKDISSPKTCVNVSIRIRGFKQTPGKIYENKFAILHLDEKWIYNKYIQNYVNIEPNIDELEKFIHKLLDKLKTDLIITSGIKTNPLFDQLKNRYLKLKENILLPLLNV